MAAPTTHLRCYDCGKSMRAVRPTDVAAPPDEVTCETCVIADSASLPPLTRRMAAVCIIVSRQAGLPREEVATRVEPDPASRRGLRAVDRALRAGLVLARTSDGALVLYPTDLAWSVSRIYT